jgi:hypothetical protein
MLKLHSKHAIERVKTLMREWSPKIYDILSNRTLIVKLQDLVSLSYIYVTLVNCIVSYEP